MICIYQEDLTVNNLQWSKCHKTQPNQTKTFSFVDISFCCLSSANHYVFPLFFFYYIR